MNRAQFSGEIVGRRAWKVGSAAREIGRPAAPILVSMVQHTIWHPGVNTGECIRERPHDAPTHGCSCGLYAYYEGDPQLRYCQPGTIHGVVTAWGDVELHPDGFRAQYARVAALVMDAECHNEYAALARRYGVPLITPPQFFDDSFISEFGEVVPLEQRPQPRWRTRRDRGARAITWLVVSGALLTTLLRSFIPVIAVVWIVVAMTVSTMRWPEWWDA